MQRRRIRQCLVPASILIAALAVSPRAFGDDHLKGVITARGNDSTLTVRTDDSSMVTVALSEATKIRRTDGAREQKADAATLIPGLRVEVKGTFETTNRLNAERVTFSRTDLKTALAIQAGVDPTDRRSLENQRQIAELGRTVDQQGQTLGRQGQQIESQAGRISANEQQIVATSGALAATNARIANLDDYAAVSSTTVYFKNGRANVDRKFKAQLQEFAAQTKSLQGYVIQVEGYASDVGSDTRNQRLSAERALAVASLLHQSGIPSPNMLAPAAMGVSSQVAPNTTAKGQAENRRTVVTVLQRKETTGQ